MASPGSPRSPRWSQSQTRRRHRAAWDSCSNPPPGKFVNEVSLDLFNVRDTLRSPLRALLLACWQRAPHEHSDQSYMQYIQDITDHQVKPMLQFPIILHIKTDDSASISHVTNLWLDDLRHNGFPSSGSLGDLLLDHPGDGHTLGLEILGVVA